MDRSRLLRAARVVAAAPALAFSFVTGCATGTVLEWPRETIEGVRGAWLRPSELGIEYTVHRYRRRDQIAWFALSDLRRGPVQVPGTAGPGEMPRWSDPESRMSSAVRVESAGATSPEGAQPLPLGRGAPRLSAGTDFAVFPPEPRGDEDSEPEAAIVVVVCEDGQAYTLEARLPWARYRPWHRYPLLPLAVAWDLATLPLLSVFLLLLVVAS